MTSVLTAWKAYKEERLTTRLHVMIRVLTCPFGALLNRFPEQGAALDVGCGHGLLVNLLSRDPTHRGLQLSGVDHDAAKIEAASRCALPGTLFSTRPLESFSELSFDVISIVDVLYTVNRDAWSSILCNCWRILRPGGIMIVKEVVNRPRWKYWAIMAQESLSVRVFRITKGAAPHFEAPAIYRKAIEQAGFALAEELPLFSKDWINHYLFVARKP
jgi:2-polyprenyl-3-methyl-5-hydroxy-6-metoxy-1,4-benzoquinol methylase